MFRGTLRPYQVGPHEEMKAEPRKLLAMEQGCGKTTLTIAVLEDMMDDETISEPGIVVCLSTLKYQWSKAIDQFTEGTSKPLVIDGTPKQRQEQYARAMDWEADYVIVNYEQVVNEWDQIARLPLGFMVVDEASFIRGFRSKRSRAIKSLGSYTDIRFALTGTPIENGRPEELFSIMEFVDPDLFGRFDLFDKTFIKRNNFGGVARYRNIPTFNATLSKAMIRKRAEDPDVAPYMPKTIARPPIEVRLDRAAASLYRTIANELIPDLEVAAAWGGSFDVASLYGQSTSSDPARDRIKGAIGQKMLMLEMLVDHPDLLRVSAAKYDQRQVSGSKSGGSAYAADLRDRGLLEGVTKSPKLEAMVRWLNETLEADPRNKVVIFSRFVEMTNLISRRLGAEPHRVYTGALNAKQKDAALTEFQTDPEIRVLIASDAGGFGLDIPQANHTMNYDLPDGAGAADQRDTRTRRTSSEFPSVFTHWMVVKGSLEERKRATLAQKRLIAKAFVDGRGMTDRGSLVLDVKSVLEFLRTSDLAGMIRAGGKL